MPRWHACARPAIRRRRFPARSRSSAKDTALLAERKQARDLKGRDRLRAVVPTFDRIVERWAVSGSSLGLRVTRSIKLLDLYGDEVFAAAVADLNARGLADVGALAIACEQRSPRLGGLR